MALTLLSAWASPLRAESVDERFLSGLRERRLFGLAESYCVEKLADSSIDEQQRAELVVELSRTYSQHAWHVSTAAAEPLWKQAVEVAYQFANQSPDSPWGVLVKTQSGLVLAARGESALALSSVASDKTPLVEEARNYLRLAARQLSAVAEEVSQRLRQPRRRPGETGPERDELLSLERNLRYHRARCLRLQGQSYLDNSPDRLNSLSQAAELVAPLAQLSEADPLAYPCRLEEVICLRLMKEHAATLRRLEQLFKLGSLPPAVALAARAEHIRLALDMERLDAALALAEQDRTVQGATSPELDLALVEVNVAAWRDADRRKEASQAKQFQSQAAALIAEIEQSHGPYWARRAESLLTRGGDGSPLPASDLDVLVRTAETHYRQGQLDASVAAYDRAVQFAEQQSNTPRAFELAFTAASIEQHRDQHRAAAERFRKLAKDHPRHPRASEAHMAAISSVASEARRQDPPQLAEYASLLEEHLQLWPDDPTAGQANWLLGRLREHEGKPEQAIAAYQKVPVDHPQIVSAIEGIASSFVRLLGDEARRGEPVEELQTAAARYFESLFVSPDGRLPERWSPAERLAAVTAAKFWLDAEPGDAPRAERILTTTLSAAADAPAEWQADARLLLVRALSAQQKYAEAREALRRLTGGSTRELLRFVDALAVPGEAADANREQAALRQEAVRLLTERRGELDEVSRAALDRHEAQALAETGQLDAAIARFEALAEENPRDGEIQEALARLLLEKRDPASLNQALAKWREIEQRSRTATPRWFRAKYYLALTYERLGNKTQAAKLITLTQVLHPELGGAEWKQRFLELLARCKT